ncbi:hypothetical protein SLA2020_422360 [Shorea laevis]
MNSSLHGPYGGIILRKRKGGVELQQTVWENEAKTPIRWQRPRLTGRHVMSTLRQCVTEAHVAINAPFTCNYDFQINVIPMHCLEPVT